MQTRDILDRLIAFDTTSDRPNLDLIAFVRDLLATRGIGATLVPAPCGTKAALFAGTGPEGAAPVILSAHSDTVPVVGQAWTRPPYRLTRAGGRLYGRGTTDMKGFLAAALAAMLDAAGTDLKVPLMLALSHDEEVGCAGVAPLIAALAGAVPRPRLVIVGEPTGLRVATGHKGKAAFRATCTGLAAHSARAPEAVNALHLAADFLSHIRALQDDLRAVGARDPAYAVPFTTLHAGILNGGTALNIVPDMATLDFEIRTVPPDDPAALVGRLRAGADGLVRATGRPEAAIRLSPLASYPGLAVPDASPEVALVQGLTGRPGTVKVDFGTEAGIYAEGLGAPVLVCGPGDMAQGHRPDEFIAETQLSACDAMLARLADRLRAGW
jgi:acetylornithine deacetylase